jgi:hypothetical protein
MPLECDCCSAGALGTHFTLDRKDDSVHLAALFRIHRSTVLDHLNRSGMARRYPALDAYQVEEAARLYEAGQSLRAIGIHFGRHASTVRLALIKTGVRTRDRNGGYATRRSVSS